MDVTDFNIHEKKIDGNLKVTGACSYEADDNTQNVPSVEEHLQYYRRLNVACKNELSKGIQNGDSTNALKDTVQALHKKLLPIIMEKLHSVREKQNRRNKQTESDLHSPEMGQNYNKLRIKLLLEAHESQYLRYSYS